MIAVTASDYNDQAVRDEANRGKYIAVAAPGVDVMGAGARQHLPAHHRHLGRDRAHADGVAALLVEPCKPTITPDEVRAILMRTAIALIRRAREGEEDGAGLVDPAAALQARSGPTAVHGAAGEWRDRIDGE